jgi:hypothetical protein
MQGFGETVIALVQKARLDEERHSVAPSSQSYNTILKEDLFFRDLRYFTKKLIWLILYVSKLQDTRSTYKNQ